jgi:phenylpropionate dioxygenase-like ring-hydroxylating dioxygenase large terminal subunit
MSEPIVHPPPYIRNAWYVAMWSEQLQLGQLTSRTLLEEPIVLFRKQDGGVAALADLCPHRFAPLSMGRLLPDGRLQCGYHGLEFNPAGTCVRNPHSNRIPPARVRSYPALEKHSLVWVWMGVDAPDPTLIPDYSCLDSAAPLHVTERDYLRMEANYELITDNLLDLSHTSYLHEGILGTPEMVDAELTVEEQGDSITVSRGSSDTPIPGLFKSLLPHAPERVDKWNAMRWSAPSCLLIHTGVCEPGRERSSGTGFWGVHILTPETRRSTHYHFAAVRWNVLTEGDDRNRRIRDELSRTRRFAFSEQDRPIIEAQQRRIDAAKSPLRPVLLSIDAGSARYRRVLGRLLQQEARARPTIP